jgi:hypothetical protein
VRAAGGEKGTRGGDEPRRSEKMPSFFVSRKFIGNWVIKSIEFGWDGLYGNCGCGRDEHWLGLSPHTIPSAVPSSLSHAHASLCIGRYDGTAMDAD